MDDSLILAELRALRGDMATAHQTLTTKVESGFAALSSLASDHELADAKKFSEIDVRFIPMELSVSYAKWVGGTALGAAIVAVVGVIVKTWVKQ
jgi:hypothetical protein